MSKLMSSIYEVDGEQQLSVWIEGKESEAMIFNVVDGKICRKSEFKKALWSRIGEVVEVVREDAEDLCVVKVKGSYGLHLGAGNEYYLATAKKSDLIEVD